MYLKNSWTFPALLVLILVSGCYTTGPYTRDGAVVGGLTGAALGTVVGVAEGKPLEGALIGGTGGAAVGGILGNTVDADVAAERAYVDGYRQQQLANAVNINDVIAMSQSGLDDQIIINQISSVGLAQRLNTADLVTLSQSGVSQAVISAMQNSQGFRSPVAPAQFRDRSPVVVEHVYGPRPYFHRGPHYRRPYSRSSRGGWGVQFDF